MVSIVTIMDVYNSKEHDGFWEAYRGCAEENRVQPDCSPFYVKTEHPALASYHARTLSQRDRLVKIFIFFVVIQIGRDHRHQTEANAPCPEGAPACAKASAGRLEP
jgi:hypothetical protein